jgi:hypothetical protein
MLRNFDCVSRNLVLPLSVPPATSLPCSMLGSANYILWLCSPIAAQQPGGKAEGIAFAQ